MDPKPDPFDRGSTLLPQIALALLPAAPVLAFVIWQDTPDPVPLSLTLLVGGMIGVIIALGRDRQSKQTQAWIQALKDESGSGRIKPAQIWDPSLEALIRPANRLGTRVDQLQRKVQQIDSMIERVIAALPDPVLLVSEGLTIDFANPAAARALKLVPGELMLVGVCRDPALMAAVQGALQAKNRSSLEIVVGVDPVQTFTARVEPLPVPGSPAQVLIAMREQTEQLMIERMRSDFIADASHEMRTPLTLIMAAVETLRGPARDDPDAWDMFLEEMDRAGKRMTALLDDLLSLSKIELEASQTPSDVVSIADLARSIAKDMERAADARDIVIDLAGDFSSGGHSVQGDHRQLRQVMVNLVENAIKYGRTGGSVTIELEPLATGPDLAGPLTGRPCIRLAVIDQGEGIEASHIPRLTERFYRIDKGRSRELGGTGLGLAIVKHIVRRHLGHLDIRSELGVGSRFSCFLPVIPDQSENPLIPDQSDNSA